MNEIDRFWSEILRGIRIELLLAAATAKVISLMLIVAVSRRLLCVDFHGTNGIDRHAHSLYDEMAALEVAIPLLLAEPVLIFD